MKTLPPGVKLFLAFSFMLVCGKAFSQTNTFPTTGAAGIGTLTPNASSLLDITSTSKGVLVPRMNKTQRDAIVSPVTGLLIFQTTNTPGFYYYDGSAWSAVTPKAGANKSLNNLTAPTAVNADLLPASTNSISLGSAALNWKNIYVGGSYYIGTDKVLDVSGTANTFVGANLNATNSGSYNTFVGRGAGGSNTTGYSNTVTGYAALANNTTGYQNTAYGDYALYANTIGIQNTANGYGALYANTSSLNTANGYYALFSNTAGFENTATGTNALFSNTAGIQNTANGSNALAANVSGNNNTATGTNALYANTTGIQNTATGSVALYSNTSGNYNTANGFQSLYSNTIGIGNTAVGFQSLYSNTYGSENTVFGFQALYSNTTGSSNTAYGSTALYLNTTGDQNTAYGIASLYSNTIGYNNTSIGFFALYSNTTGIYNLACGNMALINSTTGNHNTANGNFALLNNTTGSGNTAVGNGADVSTGNLSNASAIGSGAIVDASDKVRVGNSSVSSNGGQVSWTAYSDARIKNDVKENVPGLEFIKELRPVTFHYDVKKENDLLGVKDTGNWESKYDIEKMQFTGFIAQEVEAAAKKVNYDFSGVDKSGNVMGLRYSDFVVPLVKAVQELASGDEGLKTEDVRQNSELENLKKENESLKAEIESIKSTIANPQSAMTNGFAELRTINSPVPILSGKPETLLGQNIPNPFNNSTLIPFRIPKNCHDASIMITNTALGEVVSVIPVACNEDHLSIDAGMLSSGTYSYTLYVDGKMIDTKQMVIQK